MPQGLHSIVKGMTDPRLIVFVKAPRPGFVKTRIAATLGADAACRIYSGLVATLLATLAPLPKVELRFTPDEALDEIQPWLRPGWSASPQGPGDLGNRMHRAFVDAGGSAILIGSDCPYIQQAHLSQAAEHLATHDVVLGPAEDGGYWLIGLNRPCPALFEGIDWGSSTVLAATLKEAALQDYRVQLLPTLRDVDTLEDYLRLTVGN